MYFFEKCRIGYPIYCIMLVLGTSYTERLFSCVGRDLRPADYGLVLRKLLTDAHLPDRVRSHCMDLW